MQQIAVKWQSKTCCGNVTCRAGATLDLVSQGLNHLPLIPTPFLPYVCKIVRNALFEEGKLLYILNRFIFHLQL